MKVKTREKFNDLLNKFTGNKNISRTKVNMNRMIFVLTNKATRVLMTSCRADSCRYL